MNILVIEDNPSHFKLVDVVLSAAGNTVSRVETAEEALGLVRRQRPQIILVDLALPGMDGLSLVRALRADSAMDDIPIVVVTAFPDIWSKQDAVLAGCDGYLLKPLDTRTLMKDISAIAAGGTHHDN